MKLIQCPHCGRPHYDNEARCPYCSNGGTTPPTSPTEKPTAEESADCPPETTPENIATPTPESDATPTPESDATPTPESDATAASNKRAEEIASINMTEEENSLVDSDIDDPGEADTEALPRKRRLWWLWIVILLVAGAAAYYLIQRGDINMKIPFLK